MEQQAENPTATDAARATLRAQRRLRGLASEEEGFGFDRLPPGVCGFTYSPAQDNCPLFASPRSQNYEVHKLQDGSGILLGYVTPEEASQLRVSRQQVTLHLFPEPGDPATALVSVPFERILRPKEHSQRGGSGLELCLLPAEQSEQLVS